MHEWNSLHFWGYHWFIMTFVTLEVGCLIMQVILKIGHKYFWGFFHVLPITFLKKTVRVFKAIMTRTKFIFPKGGQNLLVVLWNIATFSWDTFNKSHQAEQKMSTKIIMDIFTNWKLIRIKYSPARLASNDYHLEDETKIKCVCFLSTHIKDDLNQMQANIKRKEETWTNWRKTIFFFLFFVVYCDQGWTDLFTVSRERKYFFWLQLKRDPDRAFLLLISRVIRVCWERNLVVFQLSGYSCFHSISQMEFLLVLTLAEVFPWRPAA